MNRLFRLRNVRIYLLGELVSAAGDSALWLAAAIWMKELTGSSALAGLVMFCFAFGSLFAPLGGVLADRVRLQPLLVALNLLGVPLVLLLLLVHGRSTEWLVYAVMLGYGLLGSAISPATTALLPAIVPADLLAEANGALQTMVGGLKIVTPLLGAGLYVWAGAGVVAATDAATFLVSAAALAALRIPGAEPAPDQPLAPVYELAAAGPAPAPAGPDPVPEGLSGGFRFIASEPVLRPVTITLSFVLLALGFTESASFSVVTAGLHRSASFIGVLSTVQGAGAIAGGLLAAPLMKRTSESLLIVAGLGALAVSMAALTVPNLAVCAAAMLVAGLAGPWLIVAAMTAVQTRTPLPLLGRVAGVFQLSLTVPQVASVGLGAALIAVVDYRVLLLVVTAVAVAAAGYLLSAPSTRRRAAPVPTISPAAAAAAGTAPDAAAAR